MKRDCANMPRTRRTTLNAGIASALALAAPLAWAAPSVWHVDNCNDTGAGSLRAVLDAPTTISGDTVDLTARTDCVNSTISLALGELTIAQDSLTILGPGTDKLTIDGTNLPTGATYQDDSRIFTHIGNGTLEVHGVTLSGGHVYHTGSGYNSLGGCLYSKKDVILESVDVRTCTTGSLQAAAAGGGVYAKGNVTLDNVTLFGNSIFGSGPTTRGGGIAALGSITATGGLVKNNSAASVGIVLGGGIFVGHDLDLYGTAVVGNTGSSSQAFATGGGIYARYKLALAHAIVSGNKALAIEANLASAGSGGAFSFAGPVDIDYSTIDGNSAIGAAQSSNAGGLGTLGNFTMAHSTVSDNTTSGSAGGIFKTQNCVSCAPVFFMRNSTVSGNHAGTIIGGVDIVNAPQTKLLNSTIAFNTADQGFSVPPNSGYQASPGLHLAAVEATTAIFHSMLVSNNTYGAGVEMDFTAQPAQPITFDAGPSNSLIRVVGGETFPSGVITGACPLLGPLQDNGGVTKTHALRSTSPAIDAGDNIIVGFGVVLELYEQRGSEDANGVATYLRMSGPVDEPSPRADIGAYEVQQDDVVFNASFDGCS